MWSGLKGKAWTQELQSIITTGKSTSAQPYDLSSVQSDALSQLVAQNGGVTSLGDEIASIAEGYAGAPYKWGGYTASGWDCSGFVNFVVGTVCGLAIPGYGVGQFHSQSHGPVTAQWFVTTLCTTVTSPEPGDLCCWQTHIGIYVGNGEMISALNASLGTAVTTVSGGAPALEILHYRRLKAAESTPAVSGSTESANYTTTGSGIVAGRG